MCGIVGYIGNGESTPHLIYGLQHLEYRGYDSCGIAVKHGNKIEIRKDVGKVNDVSTRLKFDELKGNIGFAHTRWATHGENTKENAHPHLSNDGRIVVVHNGIVENYQELKITFVQKGYHFNSETDTEVIPVMVSHYLQEGNEFIEAVRLAMGRVVGQFALLVMDKESDIVVGMRREAPLAMGIGNKEYFIASDIPAFLAYTKRVVYLQNNDMAVISTDGYFIKDKDDIVVDRPITDIDWSIEQAEKGNYAHYFIKEVVDQIGTIDRLTLVDRDIIRTMADEVKKAKGVYLVACGTAGHACMSGLYMFSKMARMHINFCVASEFDNFKHFLTKDSLIIAVSQSGETADTLDAIRSARTVGAKVMSITNVVGSALNRESDMSIMQQAGAEICVVSTKAYTSQLSILFLIVNEIIGNLEGSISELREMVRYLYYLTSESMKEHIIKLAELLKDKEHIFMIGRGLQYPTALEAALKIKETCYIHAEAFAGGELKHGTIALIEKGTPCIVFVSNETEREIISNSVELKSRGAFIIGVAEKQNEIFDYFIKVRESGWLNSICQIIPMQLLAYQLALLRGCDPDRPRNLAKSVTVR